VKGFSTGDRCIADVGVTASGLHTHSHKIEEADEERVSASGGDIDAVIPLCGVVV
jgi:hypothetical protein